MNNMAKSYTVDELREMGFAFTTNGDIVTPADMGNMAERYVIYEREKFKEEIIEALDDWVFDTFSESELEALLVAAKKIIPNTQIRG